MAEKRGHIADFHSKIGQEIGISNWHLVDQARIDAFAAATNDFQFIHVDPDRAASTPFGGTIAHGFLPLSLLSVMLSEALGEISDVAMSLNYGFEQVRFISPVRAEKNIRAHFDLKEFKERKSGQWQMLLEVSVEIQGEAKPALVAHWLVLQFAQG